MLKPAGEVIATNGFPDLKSDIKNAKRKLNQLKRNEKENKKHWENQLTCSRQHAGKITLAFIGNPDDLKEIVDGLTDVVYEIVEMEVTEGKVVDRVKST